MVHGGFYYQVEKKKIYPGELPKTLHWFKWEATLTWITGFLLFIVVYYLRGASLLIDSQIMNLSPASAICTSLAILILSCLIYDLIWNSTLIKSKMVSVVLSIIFLGSLIYLNTNIFSGRGAFIESGAIFGSLMLFNVWARILPGQSKMLKDAQAGKIPDYSISLKSKTRSIHNTYFTFPVLFIMISNHYPAVYNHKLNWLLLILLSVSGALVRHAMVTKKSVEKWTFLPAGIGMLALVFMTGAPRTSKANYEISYQQIHNIIQSRCVSCHSLKPTDDIFKEAPKGMILDTEEQIRNSAERIYQQVVVAKVMPLGNKTNMTLEERDLLAQWLENLNESTQKL